LALNSNLLQGTGSVGFSTTASLLAVSSSQQQISSSLLNVIANYATTGSNSFRANQSITGSLVVSSTITAQTLVVQTVTSSIVYSSGSNIFGSALTDRQTFTGSLSVTGSLTVNTTGTEFQVTNAGVVMGNLLTDRHSVTGSLNVTGSTHTIFGNVAIGNTTSSIAGVTLNVQGNQGAIVINGPGANNYTGFRIYNDQVSANRALEIDYAGSAYGGTLVSSGIAGESAAIVTTGAYPLQFGTSNTFRMVILANGNIGIAATTPRSFLEILKVAGNTSLGVPSNASLTLSQGGAINEYSQIGFGYTTSNSSPAVIGFITTDAAAYTKGALIFATRDATSDSVPTERMRITSAGAATFSADLSATNGNFSGLTRITGVTGVPSTGQGLELYYNSSTGVASVGAYDRGGAVQKALELQASTITLKSGGNSTMTLTSGGGVSVGSSSAAYNFNVYGASGADGWGGFFGGAGTTKGGLYLGNAGNQYGSLYFDNATNNVVLKQAYASGNVSVIANTGGVYLANGGTSWAAISSDERKKKNFETTQGLAEVLQIEPIKYHFNEDDNNSTKRLGFKAQNIKTVIPEMVLETGEFAEDGSPYLTVTPDYILPVLVKAIQELKATNDDLQAQINELKER
jgi:hypothetical protein